MSNKDQSVIKVPASFFKWLYLHPDFRAIWLQALATGLEKFEQTFIKLASKGKKNAASKAFWLSELSEGKKIILNANKPELDNLQEVEKEAPQTSYIQPAIEIISYLNEKTGQSIRLNNLSVISLIEARIREKHTVEQFKYVIDNKIIQWKGTEYEIYLRPGTLFAAKHFDEYANEPAARKRDPAMAQNKQGQGRLERIKQSVSSAQDGVSQNNSDVQ